MEKNLTPDLVSIIIPTYNSMAFLSEAIDSALNQSYSNVEVIVINDGSTDGTSKLLENYNNKIVTIYQENAGVAAARNNGVAAANGKWIAFLDADDVFYKDKISVQLNYAIQHELDLVFSSFEVIDRNGVKLSTHYTPNYSEIELKTAFMSSNFICQSTVLLKKDSFLAVSGYDEKHPKFKYSGEDAYLWYRLIKKEISLGCVSQILLKYRLHDANATNNYLKIRASNDSLYTFFMSDLTQTSLKFSKQQFEDAGNKLFANYYFLAAKQAYFSSRSKSLIIRFKIYLASIMLTKSALYWLGIARELKRKL